MIKAYAKDTGSMNDFKLFSEKQSIDSRFQIPNNFTPARINKGFLDSQNFPLISGGDPLNSDMANNFIGKREFPFGVDKGLGQANSKKILGKQEQSGSFYSQSNFSAGSKPKTVLDHNGTKFSKDQMMDVYLEDASGSKMSTSRFKIETEKED